MSDQAKKYRTLQKKREGGSLPSQVDKLDLDTKLVTDPLKPLLRASDSRRVQRKGTLKDDWMASKAVT